MGGEFSPAPLPMLVPVLWQMKRLEQAPDSSAITSAGTWPAQGKEDKSMRHARGVKVASLGGLEREGCPGHPNDCRY